MGTERQVSPGESQLFHFLDGGITIIILSNTGTTDLDQFVAEIAKRMVAARKESP